MEPSSIGADVTEPTVIVRRRQTTVRDLIEQLSAMPGDAIVATSDIESGFGFHNVRATLVAADLQRSTFSDEVWDANTYAVESCPRRPLHEGCSHEQIVVIDEY